MADSRNPTKNSHYRLAERVLILTKARYPLGGLNRQDVLDGKETELLPQLRLLKEFRQLTESGIDSDRSKKRLYELIKELKGGFCGDLANITRALVISERPDAPIEIVNFNRHQNIVIGRKKGSDPKNVKTWVDANEEGVFLDIWSEEIYFISDLDKKKVGPAIPFYEWNKKDGGSRVLVTEHYLSGDPHILDLNTPPGDKASPTFFQKNPDPVKIYNDGVKIYKDALQSPDSLSIQEAFKKITEARIIFEKQNKNIEVGNCYSTLASCHRDLGQYDEALECCTKAIEKFKEAKISPSNELIKKVEEKIKTIREKRQKVTCR